MAAGIVAHHGLFHRIDRGVGVASGLPSCGERGGDGEVAARQKCHACRGNGSRRRREVDGEGDAAVWEDSGSPGGKGAYGAAAQ